MQKYNQIPFYTSLLPQIFPEHLVKPHFLTICALSGAELEQSSLLTVTGMLNNFMKYKFYLYLKMQS